MSNLLGLKLLRAQPIPIQDLKKSLRTQEKRGLIVGAYHFARPDTYTGDPLDWQKEADNFLSRLNTVGLKCGDLVPVVDLEQGVKTDDDYNCNWYLKWLEYVGCETRTRPVVYSARWAWQLYVMKGNNNLQNQLATYPLWLASYNEVFNQSEPQTFGKSGISGNGPAPVQFQALEVAATKTGWLALVGQVEGSMSLERKLRRKQAKKGKEGRKRISNKSCSF